MQPLVLASSSPYRRELLQRLRIPFSWRSPDIDESALANESPQALVQRLAQSKARALEGEFSQHIIIGSDQVAVLNDRIIGKPGNANTAIEQLTAASGRCVHFYTGLCVYNSLTQSVQVDTVRYSVHFRLLSPEQIQRYVELEQPLDCAGSFKSEGLGISLFQAMEGSDPTSLIGLPLIRLCDMLNNAGFSLP